MIQTSRKGRIFYYVVMCILILGIVGNRHRDYLEKEYYNYPDYPELTNISVNQDYLNAYSAEESYRGMVTCGPDITLPAGQYEIEFRYRSELQNNGYEIVSDTEINSDNAQGVTYAEGILPLNDDGRCVAAFSLGEEAEHVQIKTYTDQGDLYVYGYTLKSTAPVNNDTWAMAFVILAAMLVFRFFCIKPMEKVEEKEWFEVKDAGRLGAILAVVLVGLVSSLPCFTDFITSGHDLEYHLTRIEGLKEALACGQFPVRVNPEFCNGHGMVNPVMYPELFLYFPAVLRLMNVSLIMSYQLFCIAMNLACAWAGYIAFTKLTNKRVLGVLMSAFYTLSIYRMNDLYMRAAVGEWCGMIFLPLVIYGMYALFYGAEKEWGWSVLGFTLCLQGHLLITEMAIAFSCLFALISWKQLKDKKRLWTVIKAGMVTVGVNLWYIVPLLYFYSQPMGVAAEQQPLSQYALYVSQLFSTFLYNRNLGEALGSTAGEMPSTIGGIMGIGILLYLYAAYVRKSLSEKEKKAGNILLLFGFLSLYMTTYYFPWDLIQKVRILNILAGILQFPLRILSVSSLFLSGTCALGVYGAVKGRMSGRSIALLGTILAITASGYTLDSYTEYNETELADETDSYNKNLIYGGLFYYQGTDSKELVNRTPTIVVSDESIGIHEVERRGTNLSFVFSNPDAAEGYAEVPLYYYPGYRARVNGVDTEVCAGTNGVARISIPAEASGEVHVWYAEKKVFLVSDLISVLSMLLLLVRSSKRFRYH